MTSIKHFASTGNTSRRYGYTVALAALALAVAVGFGVSIGVAATSRPAIVVTIAGSGKVQVTTTYRRRTSHYTLTKNRTIRVAAGTRVTLVERPLNGAAFGGWSGGGCRPSRASCALTVRKTTAIRARFVATATKTTITCRTVTYNGSPQTCSALVTGQGGFKTAVSVVYAGNHTNAGIVTVTATFGGNVSHLRSAALTTFVIKPAPLIIDTDIFSSPDDAGGLATAFALQLKGEANVIATVVNTRTSRPVVSTNQWKCTAAFAQFYGSTNTLLGTDTAANASNTNAPNDYIGACAGLATLGTLVAPNSAVSTYRQALASQPDGSVVIASIGYFENLQALLQSGSDQFSPLSGSALVAKKVRMLVAMGGCYPTIPQCPGENNFVGNPDAAAYVAANWPTKVVWSGYEVGNAVQTGQHLHELQPSNSPVRVSYEAYFANNSPIDHLYPSWDLTTVYHAIRPSDPALTESGPGINAVNSTTGVNTFTPNLAGNQYYLTLNDTTGLEQSLNTLLDTVPPGQ